MTKKLISVIIVLLFTYLVVCAGRSELQKELKAAERSGYTVRLVTRYDAYDSIWDMHIVLYSEEQEIKSFDFDKRGNQTGYGLIKRDSDGRIIQDIKYDRDNRVSHKTTYEYVGNNMITEHYYQYDYHDYYDDSGEYIRTYQGIYHVIYSYEYDEQGRKSSMWYGIGADTTDPVDGAFYTTYYFYDEEGQLIREELGEFSEEWGTYIAYEYDGPLLLKEEIYWVEDGTYYCSGVTEYEYDDEGRMLKCADYEGDYYSGGTEYEYDETGRMIKLIQFGGDHRLLQYWTYEYFD